MRVIDTLAQVGASSIEWFWLPVLTWSALWLLAELVLRLAPEGHPVLRYRINQALLASLPAAMITATALDLSFLLPAPEPLYLESAFGLSLGGEAPATSAHVQPTEEFPGWHLAAGLGLIAAGLVSLIALAQLAGHAVRLHRLRRELEESSLAIPLVEALRDGAPVVENRRILVLETELDVVPMTFGLVRPTIVIPASLTEADRRIALLHEMIHIRQFDYALRVAELVARALFAFHPAATSLARRCELLREMTCDAAMLSHAVDRASYAKLLFRFAVPPASPVPLSVGMADLRPHITHRIQAMTTSKMHYGSPTRMLTTVLTLVVLGAFSLGSAASLAIAQGAPQEVIISTSERSPVYEVDGVIQPEGLGAFDPSTIATIDVIKGERALEEYGERGRDGVIRIRTHASDTTTTRPHADAPETFVIVEQMPELIGGLASIQQNLRYTGEAHQAGIEGRVFVQFIVDEQGNVAEAEVTRGIGAGLDEMALEAVRSATFNPGMQRGEPVRVRMSLPVTFRISGDSPRDETRSLRTTLSTIDVSDANVSVAGRVVDSVTGDPVGGANVTFSMHGREVGAATGPDGHFRVRIERVAGEPANTSMVVVHANYPESLSQSLNTIDSLADDIPMRFAIHGAYPNPFNPSVTLTFSLPKSAAVSVSVFDVTGREVMTLPTQSFDAGERHDIVIDGSALPSGQYLYRLTASIDGQPQTLSGTVTLLK